MSTACLPTFKSSGAGPPVVFLHGLGGNRHAFDAQLAALADRYRCIAWDVPGYGGSAPLQEMTFATLSGSLNNLLDHLGIEPYAVVGHSLGGMVAQSWLARGGGCEKLVLAQTSARFGKPGSDWNRDFLAARLQPLNNGQTPADFALELITGMFHNRNRHDAIQLGVGTMAPLPAAVYRQAIECLVTFDASSGLEQIRPRTLCLAAEHDNTAPAKTMQQMAARIPNAEFQCLPGTGHLAYIEAADAFSGAIDRFISD